MTAPRPPGDLYLDLLKRCVTGSLHDDELQTVQPEGSWQRRMWGLVRPLVQAKNMDLFKRVAVREDDRAEGKDWPTTGQTMVGFRRLENIRHCVTAVVQDGVPGDLLVAGTWRGGEAIFMRAILEVLGDPVRAVWVADSFKGLPPPDPDKYPADAGDTFHTFPELAVSLAEVKANFARYGMLDERVRFLEGWFKDTLGDAPIGRLAVLRCDGDMYESTIDTLRPLYPKVSPGGFVIVDDYGCVPACKQAVDDYRREHDITDPIEPIDWTGVYWRKTVKE